VKKKCVQCVEEKGARNVSAQATVFCSCGEYACKLHSIRVFRFDKLASVKCTECADKAAALAAAQQNDEMMFENE
jgi:hypothetical protein